MWLISQPPGSSGPAPCALGKTDISPCLSCGREGGISQAASTLRNNTSLIAADGFRSAFLGGTEAGLPGLTRRELPWFSPARRREIGEPSSAAETDSATCTC